MLYYKVKAKYDQAPRKDGSIYIAHELYTPCEVKKYGINTKFCEEFYISKFKTYFCFGARFAK